jgi:hypothetical protein
MVNDFEDRLRQARLEVARREALKYLGPDWILHWTKDRIQRSKKNGSTNPGRLYACNREE